MNIGGRILWSNLKVPGVTVSVSPEPKTYAAVFVVDKMIETGRSRNSKGQKIATLKPFEIGFDMITMEYEAGATGKKELSLPFKLGNLSFVYTTRADSRLIDVEYMMQFGSAGRRYEKIVPDVLMCGDVLVIRQKRKGQGIQSVEVLRKSSKIARRKVEVMNAL